MDQKEDPFMVVKGEVEIALTNADTFLQSWQRILRTVTSAQSEELRQARGELDECLRGIEEDVHDLADSIHAIEVDPRRFNVTPVEIDQRRGFVESTRQAVQRMRETAATRTREFQEVQERKMLLSMRRENSGSGHVTVEMDSHEERMQRNNQDFVEQERMQQMMIMEQQDAQLDSVLGTVTNLKEVAQVMGDELDHHNELLTDMESHIDRSQSRMDRATGKIKEILRKSRSSRSNCCITLLIITLIILLVLIIVL